LDIDRAPCGARPPNVRPGPAPPPPLHHRIGISFNLHGSSSYASSFGIPSHFKLGYNHEALHSYNPNPIGVSDPIIVRTMISDFSYLPRSGYQGNVKKLLIRGKNIFSVNLLKLITALRKF
jgi:hypothetical protein